MAIFQKSVINKHLTNLDKEQVEKAYLKFKENYSPAKIKKIKQLKEEEYQDGFLRDLFVDVFGYTLKPDDNYNLVREFKNQADGRKADGAILNPDRKSGEKAIAVIELKSTKTKDFKNVTEQAFGYKNNQPECKYVIISNFQKLRFYVDYANEYEEFDLFHLKNRASKKGDNSVGWLSYKMGSMLDVKPIIQCYRGQTESVDKAMGFDKGLVKLFENAKNAISAYLSSLIKHGEPIPLRIIKENKRGTKCQKRT